MLLRYTSIIAILLLLNVSCRKGEFTENKAPNTKISLEEINLTGENRLNSQVKLSWFGTDQDGYVEGFEISLDNQNWFFTSSQDSIFQFSLPSGADTFDIQFYVRAIDNDGQADPSPAFLRVPLRNSPPSIKLDNAKGPKDTAFIVSTFYWTASDPDGRQSIEKVEVKFNDGSWTEISSNQNLISFVVDTSIASGTATAEVYYGKNLQGENIFADGLNVNGSNILYIKSRDIAGTESNIDTSEVFFLKNKKPGVNTLWVNAHSAAIAAEYRAYLNSAGITYDFLDYGSGQGVNQPVFWDPTFRLILDHYDKVFINSPSSRFSNSSTGQNSILLEYLAPIIQNFQDKGGKSFITTLIDKSVSTQEMANIAGAFPLQEIVRNNSGFVRIYPDSTVFNVSNINTPDLQSQTIQTGIVPFIRTSDSEDFYRAEITRIQGWTGDNLVASFRRNPDGKLKQVFFAIELHNYDKIAGSVEQLIGDILKDEF